MKRPLNFLTLISVWKGYSARQFEMVCIEEKWHFVNFKTNSGISVCARANYLRYVAGRHQSHRIAFSNF